MHVKQVLYQLSYIHIPVPTALEAASVSGAELQCDSYWVLLFSRSQLTFVGTQGQLAREEGTADMKAMGW